MSKYLDAAALRDKTIVKISNVQPGDGEVKFETSDGSEYRMFHEQDCCELVAVRKIIGDPQSLVGVPLFVALERTGDGESDDDNDYSRTVTTYTFNSVVIEWLGKSNGYYSESVQIEEVS